MAEQLRVSFTGVGLKSFSRSASSGGSASFSANLTAAVIKKMGWGEMRGYEKSTALEGDLAAQKMILGAADTLAKGYEIHVDIQGVGGFEGVRRELEGKKGKGFKHELHFKVKFADNTGCALLEQHMLKIPEGKSSLTVLYTPKAVQGELKEDLSNDDARQAVLED